VHVTRIPTTVFFGLLAIGPAACGSGGGAGSSSGDTLVTSETPAEGDVSVQVISHAFRDATVYIYLGSSRHRLGIATGKQTTIFTVPWARFAQITEARLIADPIGMNADVGSDQFTVKPGNTVVWTLEPQAGEYGESVESRGQSNVTVY
jgi:hypothetical protein